MEATEKISVKNYCELNSVDKITKQALVLKYKNAAKTQEEWKNEIEIHIPRKQKKVVESTTTVVNEETKSKTKK